MTSFLAPALANQGFVEAVGWTLLHSVWQLTVVAGLVWIADRLLRKAPSSSRYLLQLFALVLMCGCPLMTWLQMPELSDSVATKAPGEADSLTMSEPGDVVLSAAGVDGPMDASDVLPENSSAIAVQTRPSIMWAEQIPAMLRPWLGTMVVAWSIGVLVFSLRPMTGWVSVYRLRTRGTSAVPQSVHETLRELCTRLQIRRRVDVMASTVVSSPIVIGCFRSLILLPASFAARVPVSQLEAILAHELAHVKRYDYFVNLLQTLMETLFFYHPAVWWLSHRIRIEREHCCDDSVVNVLNNRVDYGRALLAVEEYRTQFMTLAMNAGGGSLLARVRRILSVRRDDAGQDTSGVLAFVGLLACTLAGLSWSAAVAGNDEATVAASDEKVAKGAASTESSPSDGRIVSNIDEASLKPDQASNPQAEVKTVPISESITDGNQAGYGRGLLIGDHGPRPETKWVIKLEAVESLDEFAARLDGLGIQLGTVVPKKTEMLYLEDITAERPTIRVVTDSGDEKRLIMNNHVSPGEQPEHDLFRRAGRDITGMHVFYFASEETEQKLLALQKEAMAKFPQRRACRVIFHVSKNAGQYTLSVRQVVLRDEEAEISDLFDRSGDLAQKLADAKKVATEKQQRIAIIVAKPDSDQARWFHALLRGTAEDRDHIAVDEESLKLIRDAIRKFQVLWLDAAQFDELRKLIPDHEFEEQHESSMVFLESDGSWLCHFEPDVKNEPKQSLKNLKSALEVNKDGK